MCTQYVLCNVWQFPATAWWIKLLHVLSLLNKALVIFGSICLMRCSDKHTDKYLWWNYEYYRLSQDCRSIFSRVARHQRFPQLQWATENAVWHSSLPISCCNEVSPDNATGWYCFLHDQYWKHKELYLRPNVTATAAFQWHPVWCMSV